MQTLIQLITIGIIFLFLVIVLLLTSKSKYFILDVLFVGFFLNIYEWIAGTTIRISLLGIQLGISDILCLYLIVCIMIFVKKERLIPGIKWIWYTVFAIFLIAIIRGLMANPFNSVMEDIRRFVWAFVVPIACMGRLPFSFDDERTVKKIDKFCNIVMVFCFVCWFIDIVLNIHLVSAQSDAETTMRVLRPEQALTMALLTIKAVYDDLSGKENRLSYRTILMIITVVLLQHRSAWVALAVGLAYLVLISKMGGVSLKRLFKSKKFIAQLFCGVAVLCMVFFALRNTSLMHQLQVGLEGLKGDDGTTLNYREQLWAAHFATLSKVQWIIGKPFGSGYYITLSSYSREITPHNAYVQTILRCGIVGISCVVIYIISVLKEARKVRFGAGEAMCVMFLVFFYAYTYNFFTSVILGIAVRTVCSRFWEEYHEII